MPSHWLLVCAILVILLPALVCHRRIYDITYRVLQLLCSETIIQQSTLASPKFSFGSPVGVTTLDVERCCLWCDIDRHPCHESRDRGTVYHIVNWVLKFLSSPSKLRVVSVCFRKLSFGQILARKSGYDTASSRIAPV